MKALGIRVEKCDNGRTNPKCPRTALTAGDVTTRKGDRMDSMPLPARFVYLIDESGCHIWQKARNNRGYGVTWFDGKLRTAHRVAWFHAHGRWPKAGLVIDHICAVKACVNPDHLQELENWQNLRRHYPPKADPKEELKRVANRRAHAKSRGTYSPNYTPERG